MQKFACVAALAAFTNASVQDIPTLIESKMHDFMDRNSDCPIVIKQASGQENFVLQTTDTYADPAQIVTGSTENFNVGGFFV